MKTFPWGRKSAAPLGPVLSCTKLGPFHASAMFWRMKDMAIAVISGTSRGAPRRGLYAIRSTVVLIRPQLAIVIAPAARMAGQTM